MTKPRKLQLVQKTKPREGPRPWETPVDGRPCTLEENEACWKVVSLVLAGRMSVTAGLDEVHRILGTAPDEEIPF